MLHLAIIRDGTYKTASSSDYPVKKKDQNRRTKEKYRGTAGTATLVAAVREGCSGSSHKDRIICFIENLQSYI